MQRHHPAVVVGHFIQQPQESRGQRAVASLRRRGKVRYEGCDLLWGAHRRFQALLHLVHQSLALIEAANAVIAGGLDAIGGAGQVVGNDHLGVVRVGLVQDPVGAQIGRALREVHIQLAGAVEVSEAHQSTAILVFDGHQLVLHHLALAVLESAQALAEDGQDLPEDLEVVLGVDSCHLLGDVEQQSFGLHVAREPGGKVRQGTPHFSFAEQLHGRAGDEDRHVGPKQAFRLGVRHLVLGVHLHGPEDDLQALVHVLLEHLLHRGSQHRELMQCQPIGAQAVLKELSHL
mmetsp:Transcript_84870/g.203420  ORF Transcript_84870/g.203420 Transcript_84870/m.203420 type:complete len:289 (+) Transcript_84870:420-1286(+)